MLSLSKMKGKNPGDYYLSLGAEDYYLEGGEPPGKWIGEGAAGFALTGVVTEKALRNLIAGVSPCGAKSVVQNALSKERRPGWDLTFSAPKSVSVLWSQVEFETRKEIERAHEIAVTKALKYLEAEAALTRRGKKGRVLERVKFIVAAFQHGTSRAQDPQLHTHALILNVCKREDGTTGTIEPHPLYQHQMTAGALYRSELAYQLKSRLSLKLEKEQKWFRVKGVPEKLVLEFSKRREEILDSLHGHVGVSARAKELAALITRSKKEHLPRSTLFSLWKEVGKEYSFDPEMVMTQGKHLSNLEPSKEQIREAIKELTDKQSYFVKRDLVRKLSELTQAKGVGIDSILSSTKSILLDKELVVNLGRYKGEIRFSTKEVLELEKELLSFVKSGSRVKKQIPKAALNQTLKSFPTLSKEQKRAVTHLSRNKGAIQVLSGYAGTGKSYVLSAVRTAHEEAGYNVIGVAPSASAASVLQKSSNIESKTIHLLLEEIKKAPLPSRTLLVVDEAGMIGTKLMHKVVSLQKQYDLKVILSGDARQLQPIEAGGPLSAIKELVGDTTLRSIRRQENVWERGAVLDFATGAGRKALKEYAKRGKLKVSKNQERARALMLESWLEASGHREPRKILLIAGRKSDASILNLEAQKYRLRVGELKGKGLKHGGKTFFQGDELILKKNNYTLGLKNGMRVKVLKVHPLLHALTVRLDSGLKQKIKLLEYPEVELGYAVTTHFSQGLTCNKALVLVGGSMQDRELSYVQASRARKETILFTDEDSAGEKLKRLSIAVERSRKKKLALSIQNDGRDFKEAL